MKLIVEKRGGNIYLYRSNGVGVAALDKDPDTVECAVPERGEVVCLNNEPERCYFVLNHFEEAHNGLQAR